MVANLYREEIFLCLNQQDLGVISVELETFFRKLFFSSLLDLH